MWFDQELGGGDAWWNAILEQIRSCDVFIVALSNNWLQSKPSLAELRYAQALNRPILPVRVGPVDSVRVNPVSTLQIIDYQNPTIDAGIQLVTAIHALSSKDVAAARTAARRAAGAVRLHHAAGRHPGRKGAQPTATAAAAGRAQIRTRRGRRRPQRPRRHRPTAAHAATAPRRHLPHAERNRQRAGRDRSSRRRSDRDTRCQGRQGHHPGTRGPDDTGATCRPAARRGCPRRRQDQPRRPAPTGRASG